LSSPRKLERDYAKADLAAVNSLLDGLTGEDIMTRFGLESRRDELLARIQALGDHEDEATASAHLFFGGRPVIGSQGIESEFGGNALTKYQDLVAKLLAADASGLRQRGIVPNKGAATLHITNVVRGSFGFLLEEIQQQGEIIDTALKSAVDNASKLLEAFGVTDEEDFRAAIERVDQRVLAAATEFFELMRQANATFRLVTGDVDTSFGSDAVARAADRATSTTIEDAEESAAGQLGGVLPEAHQFEFQAELPRRTIRGKVNSAISAEQLASYNRDLVSKPATVRLRIKRVLQNGEIVRESFTLLELHATPDATGAA
jgi:hypothetical protein